MKPSPKLTSILMLLLLNCALIGAEVSELCGCSFAYGGYCYSSWYDCKSGSGTIQLVDCNSGTIIRSYNSSLAGYQCDTDKFDNGNPPI
jgi:hypothetical protein